MTAPDVLRVRRQDLRDAIWHHGPEHFDMRTWVAKPDPIHPDRIAAGWDVSEVDKFNINDCGTTACAAGHGAILMQAAGIKTAWSGDVADYFGLSTDAFHDGSWWAVPVGDTTMADLYAGHVASSGDPRLSEWVTVLDYLGHLIKADDPVVFTIGGQP